MERTVPRPPPGTQRCAPVPLCRHGLPLAIPNYSPRHRLRAHSRLTITPRPRPPLRWPFNHLAWGRFDRANVFPRGDRRSTAYDARISNEFRAGCGG
jgi:hypothetical protein